MREGLAQAEITNALIQQPPQCDLILSEGGLSRQLLHHLLGESAKPSCPQGLKLIHWRRKPKTNDGIPLIRSQRRGHLPTLLGNDHGQKGLYIRDLTRGRFNA